MKKRLLFVLIIMIVFMIVGCKTKNDIENTSYDVNININDINEAFIPASKKAKEAVVGVSLYTKTSWSKYWR